MNCHSCLSDSEAYRDKKISPDIKIQVEKHLETCSDCAKSYRIDSIIDTVIIREKEIISNPFLSTRIMAGLEISDSRITERKSFFMRVLRPVIIMSSMAAAIFLGVILGNISLDNNQPLPLEISLLDDFTIESIDFLSFD